MAKNLDDVIQLARKMEMDGARFYSDAARKATHAQAKRLFESFSKDEERHLGIVESIAKGLGVDVKKMPMPSESIKTVFSKADPGATAGEATADELSAIKTALEMERDSYRLYNDACSKATDETRKSIFRRLAAEENQHFEMLQNTEEYLTDNKKWFLWKEAGLLTGDMSSLGQ
jgi:rubrerythrin